LHRVFLADAGVEKLEKALGDSRRPRSLEIRCPASQNSGGDVTVLEPAQEALSGSQQG
jgi:hypothetical protein